MRKILAVLVCLCFLLTCAFTVVTTHSQNRSGSYSVINGVITDRVTDFIIENFSSAEGPLVLAKMLTEFSLQNFTYDEKAIGVIQSVNLERFIFDRNFTGVCLDFATFVKTVFCIVAEHNGWDNVACYCAFVLKAFDPKSGHAFNYIAIKDDSGNATVYEFDTTWDLTRHQKGQKLQEVNVNFVAESGSDVPKKIESFIRREFSYNIISIC